MLGKLIMGKGMSNMLRGRVVSVGGVTLRHRMLQVLSSKSSVAEWFVASCFIRGMWEDQQKASKRACGSKTCNTTITSNILFVKGMWEDQQKACVHCPVVVVFKSMKQLRGTKQRTHSALELWTMSYLGEL